VEATLWRRAGRANISVIYTSEIKRESVGKAVRGPCGTRVSGLALGPEFLHRRSESLQIPTGVGRIGRDRVTAICAPLEGGGRSAEPGHERCDFERTLTVLPRLAGVRHSRRMRHPRARSRCCGASASSKQTRSPVISGMPGISSAPQTRRGARNDADYVSTCGLPIAPIGLSRTTVTARSPSRPGRVRLATMQLRLRVIPPGGGNGRCGRAS
jgi:hypothetical protein